MKILVKRMRKVAATVACLAAIFYLSAQEAPQVVTPAVPAVKSAVSKTQQQQSLAQSQQQQGGAVRDEKENPPPTGLKAEAVIIKDTRVGVKLTVNAVSGAKHYRWYRANSVNGPYTFWKLDNYPTAIDDGYDVQGNTVYYYKVATENAAGVESAHSTPVSVRTLKAPLQKASEIKANANGTSSVTLTFRGVPNATGYRVFVGEDGQNNFRLVGETQDTKINVGGLKLRNKHRYSYRVISIDTSGRYADSQPSELTQKFGAF